MSTALAEAWTPESFLRWASAQEQRFEFDGVQPVAMGGGTFAHDQIAHNLYAALRRVLVSTRCRYAGPNMGVRTRRAIRYPDAVVTCVPQPADGQFIVEPSCVFEVLSPSTERTDRLLKLRDYAEVPSILRYVLIESRFAGVLLLSRAAGTDPWTTLPLAPEDALVVPGATSHIAVADLYAGVELPEPG